MAIDNTGKPAIAGSDDTRAVMTTSELLVACVDEFYVLPIVFFDAGTCFTKGECCSIAADEVRFFVNISWWATDRADQLQDMEESGIILVRSRVAGCRGVKK